MHLKQSAVKAVLDKLPTKFGVPAERQLLLLNGKYLDPSKEIIDVLSHGTTLDLTYAEALPGGMNHAFPGPPDEAFLEDEMNVDAGASASGHVDPPTDAVVATSDARSKSFRVTFVVTTVRCSEK